MFLSIFIKIFFIIIIGMNCFISDSCAGDYNLTPYFYNTIGKIEPLDYYDVAITGDKNGNIYSLDLYRRQIKKMSNSGELIAEFSLEKGWYRNITVDDAGNLYVVDALGCKIRKYSTYGELLITWGEKNDQPGGFSYPQGICIDSMQRVIVVDGKTQITAFNQEGVLLWNTLDTVPVNGKLNGPQAVAVGPDGNLYVADTGNRRIVKFTSEGNFIKVIKQDLVAPVGISVASDGSIVVHCRKQLLSQVGEPQLYKLSPDGNLLLSWGNKGREAGQLWEAHGIFIGHDDTLWVAGFQGHNIVHYDLNENILEEWDDHNIAGGEFSQFKGAVVGKGGKLYLTDFWNHIVQVFDRYGNFQFWWGDRGQGDGQRFNFPRYTAYDENGNIYVSDDREIRKFDQYGEFQSRFGWITFPGGIAVDQFGNCWVTESDENRIIKFNHNFEIEQYVESDDIPGGLNHPCGIRIGTNGKIYVADTLNHRVLRLDNNGNFEMAWGSYGTDEGEFMAPRGLAVDSMNRIYVSESWGGKVQVFSPDGDYLFGWGTKGTEPGQFRSIYEIALDGDYFLYAPSSSLAGSLQKYALVPNFVVSGKPAYVSGSDLGVYIWSEDSRIWHVRWSSDGSEHVFSGTLHSTSPIVGINKINFENSEDFVTTTSHKIDFTATEMDFEDGIDVIVAGDGIITFDFKIDGEVVPEHVHIGSNDEIPTSLPLPLKIVESEEIILIGKPKYTPAQDAGYFLWQDAGDGQWHLRWSGDSVRTYYYNGVLTSSLGFTSVQEYSYEANDVLEAGGAVISFSGYAGQGEDGIDFYAPAGAQISFDLFMDDSHQPNFVHVGQSGACSASIPFSFLTAGGVEDIAPAGCPSYTPAQDAGYFLWQDAGDGQWHLRWSGDSIRTYYYNGVLTSSLSFTSVQEYSYEANDVLEAGGAVINFSGYAGQGEDGIDFYAPSGAQISFDLFMDDMRNTGNVQIGLDNLSPSILPFSLINSDD